MRAELERVRIENPKLAETVGKQEIEIRELLAKMDSMKKSGVIFTPEDEKNFERIKNDLSNSNLNY